MVGCEVSRSRCAVRNMSTEHFDLKPGSHGAGSPVLHPAGWYGGHQVNQCILHQRSASLSPTCSRSVVSMMQRMMVTPYALHHMQRRAMVLNHAGARHDSFPLPREDFPFAQRRRSCARELAWSADGGVLAVVPHRCRSVALWQTAVLESWDIEVCRKVTSAVRCGAARHQSTTDAALRSSQEVPMQVGLSGSACKRVRVGRLPLQSDH